LKQTTIIIIAVVASVGATLGILEGIAILNQYGFSGESMVGLIDPKQRCLTLAEENYKLLQKYKGVGRAEHWLTEDNEEFLKNTKEYGELNCIDKLTPEEIREMQLKYR